MLTKRPFRRIAASGPLASVATSGAPVGVAGSVSLIAESGALEDLALRSPLSRHFEQPARAGKERHEIISERP